MDDIRTCALCGIQNEDVKPAVVNWAGWRSGHGFAFDAIDRCRDHVGCRQRVEQVQHKRWPLRDPWPVPAERERVAKRILESVA